MTFIVIVIVSVSFASVHVSEPDVDISVSLWKICDAITGIERNRTTINMINRFLPLSDMFPMQIYPYCLKLTLAQIIGFTPYI